MKKNHLIIGLIGLGLAILAFNIIDNSNATSEGAKSRLSVPVLTIVNSTKVTDFENVCAGANGAPAGFSVQWTKLPAGVACGDFVWPADVSLDTNICKGSFSGTPGCSIYNLAPNSCVGVELGNLNDADCGVGLSSCGANELECGTTYVKRAFAHNDPKKGGKGRSDFTSNVCFTTDPCAAACVSSQGFWKTHATEWPNLPDTCSNGNTGLTIGTACYDQTTLLANLNQSAQGNAVLILSHQLIGADLNRLAGASGSSVLNDPNNLSNPYNGKTADEIIALGNNLIDGLDITTAIVAPSTTQGKSMTAAARLLDLYNTGDGGVPHCQN